MLRPEIVDAEKALNHTGYVHVAFSVGNKKLVDELTDRLRSDGFSVISGPRTILRKLEKEPQFVQRFLRRSVLSFFQEGRERYAGVG